MRALTTVLVCGALAAACRPARRPAATDTRLAPTLAVRGTLVRPGADSIPDAVVLVSGDRIVRVGAAGDVPIPPDVPVVGDADRWIVPGLIDAHVHFFQSGGLYTRPDILDLTARVPYADERAAVRKGIEDTFRRYLRSGVTSVVDAGGPFWNFDVRALAARTALAPRVAVAGPLLSTVARPQLAAGDPPIVQVTDRAAARTLVRVQAELKPDLVKLWWVLGPGEPPVAWAPVARAAIDDAHAHGLRVAVHATELETARAAVTAGADVLVHSVVDQDVDDAFVALLKKRGTLYVTTLAVFEGYSEVFHRNVRLTRPEVEIANPFIVDTVSDPFPPLPADARFMKGPPVPPAALRNVKRLWDAGIVVAAGTDAGNIGTFHGPALHRELELLVQAGLTPAQALQAATTNAAHVMGRGDVGAIEPGKLADLVVLDADPLLDVRNASRIAAVVKGGVPHEPEEILPRTATEVVQAQLAAYNARDIEAFLMTFAEDAVVTSVSTRQTTRGKDALRARFAKLFERFPQNHCRVAERRAEGDGVVAEHQIITGRGLERSDPWDVGWVRYRVANGVIKRVQLP
jgi:imidazolonepropionase-like amidohydrolase